MGEPWELYYKPATPFLADFLGSVNLVRAPVDGAANGRLRIRLAGAVRGTGMVDVEATGHPSAGEALLCIRPETLHLLDTDAKAAAGAVLLAGDVIRRAFLGHLMRYTVRVAEQEWIVDQPDPGAARILDGPVRLAVNPARIHVIPQPGA